MIEQRNPNMKQEAKVDFLVDENASRITLPPESVIRSAGDGEASVGATGPTNWWLYGLCSLAIIIAILLVLQVFSGAPGSDMQPGTPVSAPVLESQSQ